MTTNKPEVKRYNITTDKYDHPTPYETEHGRWVEYSSYKALQDDRDQQYDMKVKAREQRDAVTEKLNALQAECEKLRNDAERYRYIKRGRNWIVAATQTGVQIDREELDDLIDREMEKQK